MEQENDVDVTDVTDVSDVTDTEDSSEITWEQAMSWKERLEKAEKKLVELKKAQKIAKESQPTTSLDPNEVKKILKEEKFYDSNPDFVEYKEEISKYVAKGLDIEEAAVLVKERDESFKNKAKQKEMNLTGGEAGSTKSSYTVAELEKMSQSEYNKAMARVDKGEATIR